MLHEALTSLRRQSRPPDEVVVVVDGDQELLAVVEHEVQGARVLWTGGGKGLSVARNQGASWTGADLVAFLDDDAVAEPDWLDRLVRVLADGGAIGASSRSMPRWQSDPRQWFPPELLWTVGCSYRGMPEQTSTVRNFFGGCGVVRRQVFIDVGGFDPALGRGARGAAGGEEAEFCARALRASPGEYFLFEPAASIHHFVPDARARLAYVLRRCWADGRAKAMLLAAFGPRGLGPERHFVRRTMRSLGSSLRPAGRRHGLSLAQALVLVTGIAVAAAGCAVSLPAALVRARTGQGGRR
jgi:glycosyltransferase involved in cell wall biosynthesis